LYDSLSLNLQELLFGLLEPIPEKRLTPFEALTHESLFPNLKKVEILTKARLINRLSMQVRNEGDSKNTWEKSEDMRNRTNSTQDTVHNYNCKLSIRKK